MADGVVAARQRWNERVVPTFGGLFEEIEYDRVLNDCLFIVFTVGEVIGRRRQYSRIQMLIPAEYCTTRIFKTRAPALWPLAHWNYKPHAERGYN